MAKFPKVPPGSRSPYEPQLREKPSVEREGCGDPRCQQCYPNGRPGGDYRKGRPVAGAFVPPPSGKSLTDMLREDLAKMKGMDEYFMPSSSNSSAYNEAREAVEDYLITAPPDIDWSNVVGNEPARAALIEAIETPLKHKELYRFYGMKPLKGVLLYGAPGCGKTMFAKAAAGAIAKHYGTAAEMILINGATLQSPWAGETERQIQAFFRYAKEYHTKYGHPLTIFIDEADAILPPRDSAAAYAVRNVSAFLAEMDGLTESHAFVILATNRPDAIDEALLRDGRCDRKIKIERPTYENAREILQNELLRTPIRDEDAVCSQAWLAREAMEYLILPHHVIGTFSAYKGNESQQCKITLSHILSGALLVGLVSRAKSLSFRRDLVAGTMTGVGIADLREAINELVRENSGLIHTYAAMEIVEHLNLKREKMNA